MSFLYLLVNEEESAVKIGVSCRPRDRAMQLPNSINFERSVEVEFLKGSANSVERMLHYLFREHRHQMPVSDGHTEWFKIEVLPEIVGFLQAEGTRLGVKEMRALPSKFSNRTILDELTRKHAKEIKLKLRRLKEESRAGKYSAELAAATDRNRKVLETIQNILRELYAAKRVAGILPPVAQGLSGSLYLQSVIYESVYEKLSKCVITSHGRLSSIFVGGFKSSSCEFAKISISGNMLSDTCLSDSTMKDFYDGLPGAEQIRLYLNSLILKAGASEYDALLRIKRKLALQEARHCTEFHRAFTF